MRGRHGMCPIPGDHWEHVSSLSQDLWHLLRWPWWVTMEC